MGQVTNVPFKTSMSKIEIRQALHSDLEDLSGLFDEYRVFQGKASDWDAAKAFLTARLERTESIVFIAREGDRALGMAQLFPSFSSVSLARVFILNDLFVRQAGRRKGVASGLLAAIEHYAWSMGAVRVTLNVAIGNAAGQALYEASAWKKDAEFFMYHRFPAKA
jgi:GNAT superfamily N-acetyltransferase